ncbi:alpha/beta fold hydrolase [Allosaccharopolyspora coralli]|uniref:Alpha/beta fold hydrolase n=1 Tax=Allosaccharopolyspora coralli TaxID=2665642 RepID=A0A5Q3Q9V1_9PSEU|nr:alpha/beta hydrolase [Allosaccharopolyspora coralli]QGK71153.1 alpha/beta fold hydrolase [Allosaccharopolyspora coralli]
MHFIESGVGPPLVLLHAFPLDARMWSAARGKLENQARIITPDQRGLGESPLTESDAPGDVAEPDLDSVAADVLALLDVLDVPRAVVGGCSMGGYVAMALLRAAPERVSGLLLADTKCAADDESQRATRLNVAERAEQDGTDGWLAESMLPNLLGETTRSQRAEVVSRTRELVETQPAAGVSWAQRAMAARPDNASVLREFSGPSLVVVGQEDWLSPVGDADTMTELLPNAEQVVVPRTGHLSPLEDPDEFARVVGDWLEIVAE